MKSAIVTGAAKGLGKEIALMLAKEGYAVAINYCRSSGAAVLTLKELLKINEKCIIVQGDLMEERNVRKLVNAALKRFGQIDVLVNNIGDFLHKPLLETTKEELIAVVSNNITTAFLCSKEVLPYMEKKRYGRIINIGSVGCDELIAPQNTTPYYIGKTGVLLLTKALAKNAPKGVTVNTISPGILETSIVTPKNVAYTKFEEITGTIKKIINGNDNGKNITVAKWRPEI